MLKKYIQRKLYKQITGEDDLVLENSTPTYDKLKFKFEGIDELGIYLHVPFCRKICPYCPYNRESYRHDVAWQYARSVIKEIDYYASIVGNRPITSFYIGGGTPTTMIKNGIESIVHHIYQVLNMKCRIHMESHPNDLSQENLDILKAIGVNYLSIGVEALQDRHLKALCRPYTTREVRRAIDRAVNMGFECVNLDFIFALPNQTYREIEQAGRALVAMGIQQVATYPLFRFPYTKMGQNGMKNEPTLGMLLKRRNMLRILENYFYEAGFERSSVWAFTKKGIDKYCSVTVPLYLGIGASGGSYINDMFFLNTFNVAEYIKAIEHNEMPTALSLDLTENMQMAGWLYWRIYETGFFKDDFSKKFNTSFDKKYGRLMNVLSAIGFLKDNGQYIKLTNRGAYWLHAFEDLFSIDYISTLWGTSRTNPWPERVAL